MFVNGRPRYWIEWYDKWHLVLPALLVALLIYIWWVPNASNATQGRSSQSPMTGPMTSGDSGNGGSVVSSVGTSNSSISPPSPMDPTTLESPQDGKGFFQGRLSDAEGRAQVGSTVFAEYATIGGPWIGIGSMPADPDGRYRFQLRNFPAASYRLRARAVMPNGETSTSNEANIAVATNLPKNSRRPVRR